MAPPTVRTLSRYLLRQHVAPLGFALTALTSLMLIQQVAKQLSGLLGKGLPGAVIAEVFLLSVPFIVAVTLPMAVLVAVLYVFTRLAADNEIVAMQAGGVSVGRLVRPVLAGAAGVTLLSFLWNDQLLPRTNHQLRTLQMDIQRKKPSLALKEQVINEVVAGQFFLRAARIDGSTNKLKEVTIYDLADAERRRIITADSGRMAYSVGGRDLYLTLEDGDIEEVSRTDPTQFNRTFFTTNRMRVSGVANPFELTTNDTYKSDREMSTCEMRQAVVTTRHDIERAAADARAVIQNDLRRLTGLVPLTTVPGPSKAETVPRDPYCRALRRLAQWFIPATAGAQTPTPHRARPPAQAPPVRRPAATAPPPQSAAPPPAPNVLTRVAGVAGSTPPPFVPASLITPGAGVGEEQRLRSTRERAAAYEVEIQKKYAIALACFVFALVGVPIGLRFERGGIGLVLGVSVAIFTVYYVGLIGGEELGDRLVVSPFFAMWTPNLVCAVAGLFGLWRLRKPGDSPHGSDWGDLWPAWVPALWARWRRAGGP
ncbi:MAG TPA: LptF/LptG family permease [Gemmatimonadales bacterium]|nr:LptF/LptG family permease [Gemmatimonadales bacterium]